MSNPIQKAPSLPRATTSGLSLQALAAYDAALNSALFRSLSEIAQRLNQALVKNGTEAMTGPLVLMQYAKADLPAAASWTAGTVYVTDEVGGATLAFSDGSNWRRVQDRAIVS